MNFNVLVPSHEIANIPYQMIIPIEADSLAEVIPAMEKKLLCMHDDQYWAQNPWQVTGIIGEDLQSAIEKITMPIGPTGLFPHGRIRDDDNGEIKIAIRSGNGVVFMEFGAQITYIGLQPIQAIEMAELLKKYALRAALE